MPGSAHVPDSTPGNGSVHPRVFGILNVTPDSFSDGGRWTDVGAAVNHALTLRTAGADIIDVGGESTRPGARRVDPDVELRRVLPVIVELVRLEVPVSIDTVNSVTAAAAIRAGAETVNDVSGGLLDSTMSHVVRDAGVDYIVMHWRGRADLPDRHRDPVAEVLDELRGRTRALIDDGVDPSRIVIDPGLGFGKNPTTNFTILADIERLHDLGHRILVGHSRKRFHSDSNQNNLVTHRPGIRRPGTFRPQSSAHCSHAQDSGECGSTTWPSAGWPWPPPPSSQHAAGLVTLHRDLRSEAGKCR